MSKETTEIEIAIKAALAAGEHPQVIANALFSAAIEMVSQHYADSEEAVMGCFYAYKKMIDAKGELISQRPAGAMVH